MSIKHIHKTNFYSDIFEENTIPSVYKNFKLKHQNEKFSELVIKKMPAAKVYAFELIPDYIDLKIKDGFICNKSFQKFGYALELNAYNSVDDYIKNEFKTSFRKNFSRIKNKFESSFNVKYEVFYGDNITIENYGVLMKSLHTMLKKRFQERNDRNLVLENWEHYLSITFKQVHEKKASLFVTFCDEEPVAISLNYHLENLLYSAIASYDLDFSKFSLGNTIIYKLVEWSYNNNYEFIDLGYGNFNHKQVWCNKTYSFENNIVYKKSVYFGKTYSIFIKYKNLLVNYLISKKVNVLYKNIKGFFKTKNKKNLTNSLSLQVMKVNHLTENDSKNLAKINFKEQNYLFLRKSINDFIYSNKTHIDNVSLYKSNIENSFYVKGLKNSIKITVIKH